MNTNSITNITGRGLLTELRALRPARRLTSHEARSVAERQALLLLKRTESELPVSLDVVKAMPRLRLCFDDDLPDALAGSSYWTGTHWLITINGGHPVGRQRFSAFHELFHILEHHVRRFESSAAAEQMADHFSACVLMPRPLVKQAWGNRIQDIAELAELFGVSEDAMQVRLLKLRLMDGTRHDCRLTRRVYYRLDLPKAPRLKPLAVPVPIDGGRS